MDNTPAVESVRPPAHRHHAPDTQASAGIGATHPESDQKTNSSIPGTSPRADGKSESATPGAGPVSPPLEPQELKKLQEDAYNRGLRDALNIAEEDLGSSVKALVMACAQVNTLRQTILNNSMNEMEDLVLIIAEKIIRHSVTEQDRTIVDTVEEAIRQAVKSDELIIEINPADLSVIRAKSKEFIESLSGLENIVVRANPAIERGGCTIDSSTSTVDATMASQLRIIEEKIKGKT